MASWSGISSGSHALTSGTTHVFVDIVTLPPGVSVGNAAPSNYYGVGLVRVGFHGSYRAAIPIDAASGLIDIPPDSDVLSWNVFTGGSVTFTEYPSGSTPPPGGFISDTFTDIDGTALSAHTPDVGGAWGAVGDDLVINGGKVASADYPDAADFNLGTPPDSGNYTVEADIVNVYSTSTAAFLWARQASGLTGYAAKINGDGSLLLIRDAFTELASATFSDLAIGTSFHLKLTVSGSDISASINGVTLVTATDATYTDGDAGLGVSGGNIAAWTFDNFVATPL